MLKPLSSNLPRVTQLDLSVVDFDLASKLIHRIDIIVYSIFPRELFHISVGCILPDLQLTGPRRSSRGRISRASKSRVEF